MTAVLCAVRGAAETAVVRALSSRTELDVARRCADVAELLAAAAAGLGQVAVVSADLVGLDREAVQHLHGSGLRVVILWDQSTGWGIERAGRLGADALAPVAVPEHVVEAVVGVATRGPLSIADLMSAAPEASGPGVMVAVWGPAGAPGRTTVALGIAEALATDGALLIDADTYGGTVAPMIGMLDEAPGIAAACRAAATGRLDPQTLAGLTPVVSPGLRVLSGIARPERWPELPAAHLDEVWDVARQLSRWVVVDCGFSIEHDEMLSYDTRAPQRNGATLSALAAADIVVLVGAADPIGLQRLVRAVLDLPDVAPTATRVVVATKVRSSAAGPRPGRAIRQALSRYAGVEHPHLLAWDPQTCDAALLAGRLIGEQVPGSALYRGFVELADALRASTAELVGDRAH